jgi:hypothetical protein
VKQLNNDVRVFAVPLSLSKEAQQIKPVSLLEAHTHLEAKPEVETPATRIIIDDIRTILRLL